MYREYEITPVTKPRMTRRDKWGNNKRPSVAKYHAFRDMCKLHRVQLPCSGASIQFHLPMPKSWNKKKRAALCGMPHKQVPDISNLLKALEDAVYADDSKIWHYKELSKIWAKSGKIIIIN